MTVRELKALLSAMPEDAIVLAPFHYDEIHYVSPHVEEHEIVQAIYLDERMGEDGEYKEVVYLSATPGDEFYDDPEVGARYSRDYKS